MKSLYKIKKDRLFIDLSFYWIITSTIIFCLVLHFPDSLSDLLPFESIDVVVSETPTPPRTVNPLCIVQDPVLQTVPVSTSQNRPFPPGLPLNSQNNGTQSFPIRSPLSTVDQNLPATHRFGPTDEQRRKVEAIVFMGTQVVTTAMACVGVLFTDDELANGNTSGSNGYRKLDDLKLRFLATALRQKFDSPVFSDPLFGQEKCSVKCNSVFFGNSKRKLCCTRNKSHTMVSEAYFVPLKRKPAGTKS